MNVTRRLFAALIPAAPAAVVAERSGLGSVLGEATRPSPPPTPHPVDLSNYAWKNAGKAAIEKVIPLPKNWSDFRAAEEAIQKARQYQYHKDDLAKRGGVDVNIRSLKSVSKQHKLHMHIKQQEEKEKARRTWYEALLDQFGVRDYIMKQRADNGVEGVASTSSW